MKLVAITGTNAKHSYNRKLLQFMAKHFAKKADIEVLDIDQVSMFDETDDQTDSPVIQTFNQKISQADGVIIATPEHNHTIPSSLNSLLEWLSFNIHPLDGKPVMIVGASYSEQGSSRAQLHLRQILDAPGVNATVMPGNEFLLGFAYISVLDDYVRQQGGFILTDSPVKEIIVENGQVKGAIATGRNDQTITVHVKAVVLASGGFGANTKMLQKYNTYWTEIDDDIKTSNSPAITGDGIILGRSVGADLVGMGFTQMMPVSDPNTGALFSGLQVPPANFIMVNQEGKRFVDEYGSRDKLAQAAIDNGGLFYLISDDNIKATAYNTSQEKIDAQVAAGTLFRDDSLEGLAKQIGVNPEVFVQTINNYNSYVDAGHDPEFDKGAFDLKVEKAPFYATPRKPAVHHTMGGLKIDTQAHVLNEKAQPISGLYAAGEVAGGLHAGNRLGGNSLTDIFTFGRIAAQTAVDEWC